MLITWCGCTILLTKSFIRDIVFKSSSKKSFSKDIFLVRELPKIKTRH